MCKEQGSFSPRRKSSHTLCCNMHGHKPGCEHDKRKEKRAKVNGGVGRTEKRAKVNGGDGRTETRSKVNGGKGRNEYFCACGSGFMDSEAFVAHLPHCATLHTGDSIPDLSNDVINKSVKSMQSGTETFCQADVCAVCDELIWMGRNVEEAITSQLVNLVDGPPPAWVAHLSPSADLDRLLIDQYILDIKAPQLSAQLCRKWKALLLSCHPDCVKRGANGRPESVHCCGKCSRSLNGGKGGSVPHLAIANGLFMGHINEMTAKKMGFSADVTDQEWRLVSRVVQRFQVLKVRVDGENSETARNGIKGHSISCEAPTNHVATLLTKLPDTKNATLSVQITGRMTKLQKIEAKKSINVRQRVVSSVQRFGYQFGSVPFTYLVSSTKTAVS